MCPDGVHSLIQIATDNFSAFAAELVTIMVCYAGEFTALTISTASWDLVD